MNPFDLYGPDFLYFYTVLGVTTGFLLYNMRRMGAGGAAVLGGSAGLAADPYLIAYLWGGPEEALRIAALSLFDRGLLIAPGLERGIQPGAETEIVAAKDADPGLARRPIEQAMLKKTKDLTSAYDGRAEGFGGFHIL